MLDQQRDTIAQISLKRYFSLPFYEEIFKNPVKQANEEKSLTARSSYTVLINQLIVDTLATASRLVF